MKITDLAFVKGVVAPAGFPRDGLPEVVFLGRSNVGKSSLLNLVTGRRGLARISRTPGKTREINYFLVNGAFYLVDLPGYGYAKVARTQRAAWTKLIVHVLQQRPTVKLILHLVDSRHPPTELDREAMALCAPSPARYVVVQTKVDKPNQRERAEARRALTAALDALGLDPPVIESSSATRRGADAIRAQIAAAVAGLDPPRASGTEPPRDRDAEPPQAAGPEPPPAGAPHSGTSTTPAAATQPAPSSSPDASASRSQRPRRST